MKNQKRLFPVQWIYLLTMPFICLNCIYNMSFFFNFIMLSMERLSDKVITYLPHLRFIGLGVVRTWDLTCTFFGPGLSTRSGLHLTFAKEHTSFQTISDRPVAKRFNLPESLGLLRRSIEIINLFSFYTIPISGYWIVDCGLSPC